jgi:hypothetical protein
MTSWRLLDEEIARWRDLGRIVELWWRDDDAIDATPELDRLLALHRDNAVPLALAVVPAKATAALAERVGVEPGIDVLQHGYAHVNHALPPAKKIELGAERPAMVVLGELGTGWLALERIGAARALPVLVPPWNRIAPALVPALPEIGFKGLSTFGEVRRPEPVRGLRQVNTHVDLVDWKASRGFVGEDTAIFALVQVLAAARAGAGGPVGVLSHHLAMDEPAWNFLMFLWARAKEMSGIQFRPARELFVIGETRA